MDEYMLLTQVKEGHGLRAVVDSDPVDPMQDDLYRSVHFSDLKQFPQETNRCIAPVWILGGRTFRSIEENSVCTIVMKARPIPILVHAC
jgi:hypothetical protein